MPAINELGRSISRLTAASVFFLVALVSGATAAPKLFFYPPPHKLADGSIVASPVTSKAEQLTTDFPAIDEMSGVALIVYWSQLCPAENHCDFSLIDKVLSYWGERSKTVVLAVATVGYPIKTIRSGNTAYQNATPEWVLSHTSRYSTLSPTINSPGKETKIVTEFPSYADPYFVSAIQKLVQALAARYDGNPNISEVRISTGLLTEDNPSVEGLKSSMPGFSESFWIAFCRKMTDVYLASFKKTQLEFDVGRISWALAGKDQKAIGEAQAFYQYLIDRKIFIAFNGLRDKLWPLLTGAANEPAGAKKSLLFLSQARRAHLSVGLEAYGPISLPEMQNTDAIGHVICSIEPDRLIFFTTFPSLINYQRHGANAANKPTIIRFLGPKLDDLIKLADRYLSMVDTDKYCRH